MQPVFKGAATLALALSMAGIGPQAAMAGGKSPPAAYDFTLENLSYDIYGIKATYLKIDVKGANIAKADMQKMLAADTPSADRLKALQGFTAGSVDIPATNFSFEAKGLKISAACTGDKMEKIGGGKIGKYAAGSCTGEVFAMGEKVVTFAFAMKGGGIVDYNFVHAYRLWTDKAGPDDKEAVALHGPSTIEGATYSITSPAFDIKGESGKTTITEGAKIKLGARPLKDIVAQATAFTESILNLPPEDQNNKAVLSSKIDEGKQILLEAITVLWSIQPPSSTSEGSSFTETIRDPQLPTPVKLDVKFGKTEAKGFDQTVSDITFSSGKVTGRIGSYSLKGFSLAPALAEFKKLLAMPSDAIMSGNAMAIGHIFGQRAAFALYSNLGTLSLNDLEVNVKDVTKVAPAAAPGNEASDAPAPVEPAKPETVDIAAKLKNLTLQVEKPFNGIPTSVRFSFDNLQIPTIVATLNGNAEALSNYQILKQAGIEQFNASFAFDTSWNKDARELNINELSVGDAGFGRLALKAAIGNFSETMFSWDPGTIQMSALGLTAKTLSLHAEDKGGLDKILKIAAIQNGTSPAQLKAFVPVMAGLIPAPYADMESVQKVRDALLAYWANPGKLDIGVKARNGVGLSLVDFLAASKDPATLDAKLDVTAAAAK